MIETFECTRAGIFLSESGKALTNLAMFIYILCGKAILIQSCLSATPTYTIYGDVSTN
jgi:hypothetical protein